MKLSSLYQKTGLGISIINGFAKECGGDFDMRYEGNKAVMLLRIPAATPPDDRFYSSNFEFFNRGVPDLLELAMAQVVNFFGGDQHTVTEKSK